MTRRTVDQVRVGGGHGEQAPAGAFSGCLPITVAA